PRVRDEHSFSASRTSGDVGCEKFASTESIRRDAPARFWPVTGTRNLIIISFHSSAFSCVSETTVRFRVESCPLWNLSGRLRRLLFDRGGYFLVALLAKGRLGQFH